mmetsp:Transcript_17705/g.38800  ORF Transcript_17705/g.38800 Transcript_17705/m.38800 type:complete len:483 (+) Transcript_17705:73-1521(+)
MVDYYHNSGLERASNESIPDMVMRFALTPDGGKLVIAMVGLPARGKSFIAHKLHRFLSWSGHKTEIFNAGQKRRKNSGVCGILTGDGNTSTSRSNFFDSSNPDAASKRENIAMETLDTLLDWLDDGGEIAIFDATNSTVARRKMVTERCLGRSSATSIGCVFVETICDDPEVLQANLLIKVRASPDFRGMKEEDALSDLRDRISHYERVYETITDAEGAYIKIYNLSRKVTANQVFGRMSKSILPYMMAIHIGDRSIYLLALPVDSGELHYGFTKDKAPSPGSNTPSGSANSSPKTPKSSTGSLEYTERIVQWAVKTVAVKGRLRVLSSTRLLAVEAASALAAAGPGIKMTHESSLNPLDRGTRVGYLDDDDHEMEFDQRFEGGGESYADLVRRLEPCLLDIEGSVDPVLVISHVGPCRALRAYFLGYDVAKTMLKPSSEGALSLANRTQSAVELHPKVGGGWEERIHNLKAIVTTPNTCMP